MIPYLLLGLFAFGVSFLTLFSGFGLGTLLMPAFALFLPVPVAVACTAVVHAANNLFKAGLLLGRAKRDVLWRFGVPAVAASFLGAALLTGLSAREPLLTWTFLGRPALVTPLKLVMGALILFFALLELLPALQKLRAPARWLPLGGALSGFFGGLSGHQGALRAVFLSPLGLPPAEFAATQAALALMVDGARLLVYGWTFWMGRHVGGDIPWPLVAAVTLCAFAGAFLGKKWLPKMTLRAVQRVTGALLVIVALALMSGMA